MAITHGGQQPSQIGYRKAAAAAMQRRTKIAPGIYQDAHGYGMIARVGTHPNILSSGEIRYPLNTPLDDIKADWHREKMRLIAEQSKRGEGPTTRGTLAADVPLYLKTATLTSQRRKEREFHLRWWCAHKEGGRAFGQRRRKSLENAEIRRALGGLLANGVAASTVNKYRHSLSHVFTILDGKSAPNPVIDVPKYDEPDAELRDRPYWFIQLIVDDIRETGQAGKPSLTKARVRVLAYVPITPMQLRRLKRTAVDWERSELITAGRGKGKGTLPRRKKLTPQGLEALRAFDAVNGWEIKFSRSSLHRTFTAARNRVVARLRVKRPDLDTSRLATMRPYDLRHSFATMVRRATGDSAITGEYLDHADPRTTARYEQAAVAEHVLAASDKVVEAFAAPAATTIPAAPATPARPRLVKSRERR